VPDSAVEVKFDDKTKVKIRLIDCVGYMVDGALGANEDDKPRLVKTPWSNEEIPFEQAAEIGTKKVIEEYSTIGIVVTTDGSIGEIPRKDYVRAEERVIKELKQLNKPFVIVLNCLEPEKEETIALCAEMQEKYQVSVIALNALKMTAEDISFVMEKTLLEFNMFGLNVDIPKWMQALPADNKIICDLIENIKERTKDMVKMSDFANMNDLFADNECFMPIEISELKLGVGVVDYRVTAKDGLYYKVLSDECGETIEDDYSLMNYIKSFSQEKKKYGKIKDALITAEESGYGVVLPTLEEMNLEEPVLVKNGGSYGVKLKASAPSLHIMKVDVSTEVAPIVGTERQGEDLINFIMNKFEDNPAGIWETNMFGRSLHDLVNEGLNGKLTSMPKEAQGKMRKTLTRIVNENRGGIICILL
jgi:stage IV sporulation protein A